MNDDPKKAKKVNWDGARWVCGRCMKASRKLRDLRHVARCRNRPIPMEALATREEWKGWYAGAKKDSDQWLKDNG